MQCPRCEYEDTKVLDSRAGSMSVKRRRVCPQCQFRFTTAETLYITELYVKKRNGSQELFDEGKLERGIRKAYNKRTIDEKKIVNIVTLIKQDIARCQSDCITSEEIGHIVLQNLKTVDEAAYICFHAMFGNFDSVKEFQELLDSISSPQADI